MNNLLVIGFLTYLLGKVIETGILSLVLNSKNQKFDIKGMIKGQIQLGVVTAILVVIILKLLVL